MSGQDGVERYSESTLSSLLNINSKSYLLRLNEEKLTGYSENIGESILADDVIEYVVTCAENKVFLIIKDKNEKIKIKNISFETIINEVNSINNFDSLIKNGRDLSLFTAGINHNETLYLIGKNSADSKEKLLAWEIKDNNIVGVHNTLDEGEYVLLTSSSLQIDVSGKAHLSYVIVNGENYFVFYRYMVKAGKWSSPYLIKRNGSNEVYTEPVLVLNNQVPYVFWTTTNKSDYKSTVYSSKINESNFNKALLNNNIIVNNKRQVKHLSAGIDNGTLWVLWWNNGMEGCIKEKNNEENWTEITPPKVLTAIRYSSDNNNKNEKWGQRAFCQTQNLNLFRPDYLNISKINDNSNSNSVNNENKNKRPSREELLDKMRRKYNVPSHEDEGIKKTSQKYDVSSQEERVYKKEKDGTDVEVETEVREEEQHKFKELEKENKELKDKISKLEHRLGQLDQLKEENDHLKNQVKELTDKIKKIHQERASKSSHDDKKSAAIRRSSNRKKEVDKTEQDKSIEKLKIEKNKVLKEHIEELDRLKEYTEYLKKLNVYMKNLKEKENTRNKGKRSKLRRLFEKILR